MAKPVKVLCDRCESKIVAGDAFCEACGHPTQWANHEERTGWEVAQWRTANGWEKPTRRQNKGGSARRPSRVKHWLSRPFAKPHTENSVLTLISAQSAVAGESAVNVDEPAVLDLTGKSVKREAPAMEEPDVRTAPARHPSSPARHPSSPASAAGTNPALAAKPMAPPTPIASAPRPAVERPKVSRPEPKPAPTPGVRTPRVSRPEPKIALAPAVLLEPEIAPSPMDGEPLRDTPATVKAMRLLNARVAELDAAIRELQSKLADRPHS